MISSRVKTRRFRKRNWVAFMKVNISELEKENGELYMLHGNLDIDNTMVYLRFSEVVSYTVKFLQNRRWENMKESRKS